MSSDEDDTIDETGNMDPLEELLRAQIRGRGIDPDSLWGVARVQHGSGMVVEEPITYIEAAMLMAHGGKMSAETTEPPQPVDGDAN